MLRIDTRIKSLSLLRNYVIMREKEKHFWMFIWPTAQMMLFGKWTISFHAILSYINNLIIIIMEDEADKSMRIIRDVQRYSMSLASVFRTSFRWVSLYNAYWSMVLIALYEQRIHQRKITEQHFGIFILIYIINRVLITILALVAIADRIAMTVFFHLMNPLALFAWIWGAVQTVKIKFSYKHTKSTDKNWLLSTWQSIRKKNKLAY